MTTQFETKLKLKADRRKTHARTQKQPTQIPRRNSPNKFAKQNRPKQDTTQTTQDQATPSMQAGAYQEEREDERGEMRGGGPQKTKE